jgi:hypothetical protein
MPSGQIILNKENLINPIFKIDNGHTSDQPHLDSAKIVSVKIVSAKLTETKQNGS